MSQARKRKADDLPLCEELFGNAYQPSSSDDYVVPLAVREWFQDSYNKVYKSVDKMPYASDDILLMHVAFDTENLNKCILV